MSVNESKELGIFHNLNLIPEILKQNQELLKRVEKLEEELIPELDLTKRANVKKYLGIDEGALQYRMNNGILKQGEHYIKKIKNNKPTIVFVEKAIIEYKKGKK